MFVVPWQGFLLQSWLLIIELTNLPSAVMHFANIALRMHVLHEAGSLPYQP